MVYATHIVFGVVITILKSLMFTALLSAHKYTPHKATLFFHQEMEISHLSRREGNRVWRAGKTPSGYPARSGVMLAKHNSLLFVYGLEE